MQKYHRHIVSQTMLWLAAVLLMLTAVVPHHHHGKQSCIALSEHSTHYHDNDRHHGDDHCAIAWLQAMAEAVVNHDSQSDVHNHTLPLLPFVSQPEWTDVMACHKASVGFTTSAWGLPATHVAGSQGLRAPPAV